MTKHEDENLEVIKNRGLNIHFRPSKCCFPFLITSHPPPSEEYTICRESDDDDESAKMGSARFSSLLPL